jgi:hypothetical protein
VALIPAVLAGVGCEHTRSALAGIPSDPKSMAAGVLSIDASVENLKPALRALDGRTYKEDSLDAVRTQLALTSTLLLANEGNPDDEELWAASVGLKASCWGSTIPRISWRSRATSGLIRRRTTSWSSPGFARRHSA